MDWIFYLSIVILFFFILLALILLAPIAVVFKVDGDMSVVKSKVYLKVLFLSLELSNKSSLLSLIGMGSETDGTTDTATSASSDVVSKTIDEKVDQISTATDQKVSGISAKVDSPKSDPAKFHIFKNIAKLKNIGRHGRPERSKEDKNSKKSKKDSSYSLNDILELAKLGYGIGWKFLILVKGILSQLHIRDASFNITYGLSDPADTGTVCGYLHTVAGIVRGRSDRFNYSVCPVFMDEVLDVNMSGSVKFRLFSFIPPIFRFIFDRNVLKAGWWLAKKKYSTR